jgi:putative spermidine/putrescine transport system permease protein
MIASRFVKRDLDGPVPAGARPQRSWLHRRAFPPARKGWKLRDLLLTAPLLIFLVANLVVPAGLILFQVVDNRPASAIVSRTVAALRDWDGVGLPADEVFVALALDLKEAQARRTLGVVSSQLANFNPGFPALLSKTARAVGAAPVAGARDALVRTDPRWSETAYWGALKAATSPFTAAYLLRALDLKVAPTGGVQRVEEHQRVFNTLWLRTLWIATVSTLGCVLLGYPLAYLIASATPAVARLLMFMVVVPLWSSVLVRSAAWVALLQSQGPVAQALQTIPGLDDIQLIRNRTGVYIAMIHVLLPYFVLPLIGIMRRIPPTYVRAAVALGAHPALAFLNVYLQLTGAGIATGCAFVFILGMGFYITPALVGGREDQLISYFISYYMNESLNWNLASAISVLLIALTGFLVWLSDRFLRLSQSGALGGRA